MFLVIETFQVLSQKITFLTLRPVSATVLFVELGVLIKQNSHIQSQGDSFPVQTFMLGYFYSPNEPNLIRYFLNSSKESSSSSCPLSTLLSMFYTVLPISIPVLLMVITTSIQVFCLSRRRSIGSGDRDLGERRGISYTIVSLTCLFVICSAGVVFTPLSKCTQVFDSIQGDLTKEMRWHYCSGYLLFFLNSALNPVILVLRGQKLQEFCRDRIMSLTGWGVSGAASLRRAVTAEEMIVRSPVQRAARERFADRRSQCV